MFLFRHKGWISHSSLHSVKDCLNLPECLTTLLWKWWHVFSFTDSDYWWCFTSFEDNVFLVPQSNRAQACIGTFFETEHLRGAWQYNPPLQWNSQGKNSSLVHNILSVNIFKFLFFLFIQVTKGQGQRPLLLPLFVIKFLFTNLHIFYYIRIFSTALTWLIRWHMTILTSLFEE